MKVVPSGTGSSKIGSRAFSKLPLFTWSQFHTHTMPRSTTTTPLNDTPLSQSVHEATMNLSTKQSENRVGEWNSTSIWRTPPWTCTKDQYQEGPSFKFHNQEPAPVDEQTLPRTSKSSEVFNHWNLQGIFSCSFRGILNDWIENTDYNKVFPFQKWFQPLITQRTAFSPKAFPILNLSQVLVAKSSSSALKLSF